MLELDSNLTVGASIVLSFVLPGFGHAVSQATVLQESPLADTDARRLGCQFVNLDERFRQLIRQYVAARRREENVFVEADV